MMNVNYHPWYNIWLLVRMHNTSMVTQLVQTETILEVSLGTPVDQG